MFSRSIKARLEKWEAFYARAAEYSGKKFAPAFIQESTVGGLWSVQYLVTPAVKRRSLLLRMLKDPPYISLAEPYYNGWPGDHRGWMRFQTKEEARDFYKFSTGRISFEEFKNTGPRREMSHVRIDLDDDGEFVPDA